MTLSERALEIARGELGKHEVPKGSNWGPDIKKYLASVGIRTPNPWCMAFVYWCFEQAAKEMNVKNPLAPTGGVLLQWSSSKKRFGKAAPDVGDVFIMDFGKGKGHTGFVEKINGTRFETIEGNSNDEGSREGYEVCQKPNGRPINGCIGYLRFT